MPFSLASIYHPITGHPFSHNDSYVEVAPCAALRPYIRCFWGSPGSYTGSVNPGDGLVIPDTCMDIMLTVNYTKECGKSIFSGLDDAPFLSTRASSGDLLADFSIRFYFWAVPLFVDESMRQVKGAYIDPEAYFTGFRQELGALLIHTESMKERIAVAERYLLRRLNHKREHPAVMNAVYAILRAKGNIAAPDIAGNAAVGERQLQRLFAEYIGLPPKRIAMLVRYQCLWQEIMRNPNFNVQDAVEKYGYTDQPHLLAEFRRFHSMNPTEAKAFAQLSKPRILTSV